METESARASERTSERERMHAIERKQARERERERERHERVVVPVVNLVHHSRVGHGEILLQPVFKVIVLRLGLGFRVSTLKNNKKEESPQ